MCVCLVIKNLRTSVFLYISQVSIAGPVEGVEDARRRIRVSALTVIPAEPLVAFLSLSKFNFPLL